MFLVISWYLIWETTKRLLKKKQTNNFEQTLKERETPLPPFLVNSIKYFHFVYRITFLNSEDFKWPEISVKYFRKQRLFSLMEKLAEVSCGDLRLSYSRDQILALRPPDTCLKGRPSSKDSSTTSSHNGIPSSVPLPKVIAVHPELLLRSPTPSWSSSWPPGLAAWVERQIFPVLLPQQVWL